MTMTTREKREILARALIEKRLLRRHPDLSDAKLELLVEAGASTQAYNNHVIGNEAVLDVAAVLEALRWSDAARIIFGHPGPQPVTSADAPDVDALSPLDLLNLARGRKT